MMKRLLIVPAIAALAMLPVRADETLQLRHTSTEVLTNRLKAHPEFNGVILVPSSMTVNIRGSEEQIAAAKSAIALLDVPSTQYSVKIQVVRCTVASDGKVTERTVMAPLISTLDGVAAKIGINTQSIALTPTSNPDGTVTLAVEFRQADEAGDIGRWAENERRMTIGKTERFLGLTDSPDKTLRKAVREGKVVKDRGAYTADYLDITVNRIDYRTGLPG